MSNKTNYSDDYSPPSESNSDSAYTIDHEFSDNSLSSMDIEKHQKEPESDANIQPPNLIQEAEDAMQEFMIGVSNNNDMGEEAKIDEEIPPILENEEAKIEEHIPPPIPENDKIPFRKPKWLSSKYTPVNNGKFTLQAKYPELLLPATLEKRIAKRLRKLKKNKQKGKPAIIYKETSNPIEWLRRCYWCQMKAFKTTQIIDPQQTYPDMGTGDLNSFEYLKFQCNKQYKNFNKPGYQNKYICFHKHQKRWHPQSNQIKNNLPYEELADQITKQIEQLEKDKNMKQFHYTKREARYWNKAQKLKYDLNRFGIKPQIDITKPLTQIVNDLKKFKTVDEYMDEDGHTRYTKLNIITKEKIKTILKQYDDGKGYVQMAKSNKISFRRTKKLIKLYYVQRESEDEDIKMENTYQEINKSYLLHEEINRKQIHYLRGAVFKMGNDRNCYKLTQHLHQQMDHMFKKPMISISKTKYLLKKYCSLSYKGYDEVNQNKISPDNLKKREQFVRLIMFYAPPFNFKNMLSIDETAWYSSQHINKHWSLIGQPSTISTKTKGKKLTFLAAMSIEGVESFIIIQGGCKKLLFCYFIYEAATKFIKKYKIKPDDLLLVFDNAKAHVESFAGWWCRQLPGMKISNAPYSPEFNPIERLFRSMKTKFPDSYDNDTMEDLTSFMIKKLKKMPSHLFRSYYQTSLKEMGKFICQLNNPQKYGELVEKTIPIRRKRKPIYKIKDNRYIITNDQEVDIKKFIKREEQWKLKERKSSKVKGKKRGRPKIRGFRKL